MKTLRPLLLNTSDTEGGAAIATRRIHSALRRRGVDSTLLVQRKEGADETVIGPTTRLQKALAWPRRSMDQLPVRSYRHRESQLFSPAVVPDNVGSIVAGLSPDLVHLFWVTGGFLRPESLPGFARPIVWTLHDMWPFTGGCHYDVECGKYQSDCGACPRLRSDADKDLSRRVWERKKSAWEGMDLTVVATSRWLAECARKSSLFSTRRIEIIPNCIDVDVYRPIHKADARRLSRLPTGKKLILLSAFGATTDPRKGYQHLAPAIQILASRGWAEKAELVVLGAPAPERPESLGINVTYIMHLGDEASQVLLYSACDVLVAPSVQENLSNTVLEALTCGTPVVAFDIGGMPDMVEHQVNGYLAKPFDPEDLALGMEWVLDDPQRALELSTRARADAANRFRFDVVARQYQELYRELLQ